MKKYRKRLPFRVRIAMVFGIALLTFLVCLYVAHSMGYRYTVCSLPDGTSVKFAGRVDSGGKMILGTVYYPDGSTANVNPETYCIEYSNGSVYSGAISDTFERSGYGSLTLKNGDSVTGTFAADMLNGYAVYTYSTGDIYEGFFVNNVKQGEGKYTYADGSVYEGDFYMDARHGNGTFTDTDGSEYSGGYEMGLRWGTGVCVYANGDRYEGEFEMDMRHGEGTYTWADGESYTGSFENNNINGLGTYTWTDGRASYNGYFVNGEIVIVDQTADNETNKTEG